LLRGERYFFFFFAFFLADFLAAFFFLATVHPPLKSSPPVRLSAVFDGSSTCVGRRHTTKSLRPRRRAACATNRGYREAVLNHPRFVDRRREHPAKRRTRSSCYVVVRILKEIATSFSENFSFARDFVKSNFAARKKFFPFIARPNQLSLRAR
jgi:hypothetical protein